MAGDLTVLELIRNGTMSAEMAATLWEAMDERMSLIVAAGPSKAGKTTTMDAVMGFLPADLPRHDMTRDPAQAARLAASPDGGYLVVPEFSDHTQTYLRGDEVVRVFETAQRGFSIAGTIHATTPQDAFAELRSHGAMADALLARICVVVTLAVLGPRDAPVRRVDGVWAVDGVTNGAPRCRLLHRWDAATDTFQQEDASAISASTQALHAERAARLAALAAAGHTSHNDLAGLLAS